MGIEEQIYSFMVFYRNTFGIWPSTVCICDDHFNELAETMPIHSFLTTAELTVLVLHTSFDGKRPIIVRRAGSEGSDLLYPVMQGDRLHPYLK